MTEKDYTALARDIRKNLHIIKAKLEMAHAGIVVAAGSLKYQAAERDEEVAHVLEHFVGGCVYDQIDRADTLIVTLDASVLIDSADLEGGEFERVPVQ
jgi:hypothetical protein